MRAGASSNESEFVQGLAPSKCSGMPWAAVKLPSVSTHHRLSIRVENRKSPTAPLHCSQISRCLVPGGQNLGSCLHVPPWHPGVQLWGVTTKDILTLMLQPSPGGAVVSCSSFIPTRALRASTGPLNGWETLPLGSEASPQPSSSVPFSHFCVFSRARIRASVCWSFYDLHTT